jgi:hypothetical protein
MKIKHETKSDAVKEHSCSGWKMLMIPNIILTAWFMCLVTGVPTLSNDIKAAYTENDWLSVSGFGALMVLFFLASFWYGIGLTKTELSANIEGTRDNKKRNKAALWAMFTLICITGIAGGIWRYNDVKKDQSKQAQLWLSENHVGYQKYLAMTENGAKSDDDIADRGMTRLETDWINENYKTPWYMDLPLVFIMALSINLTFGLAVRLSHEELPDSREEDQEGQDYILPGGTNNDYKPSETPVNSSSPAYSAAPVSQDLNPIKELFSALLNEIRATNIKNVNIENSDYYDLNNEQKRQILTLCVQAEYIHQEGLYKGSPNKQKIANTLGLKRPNVSRFLNEKNSANNSMHTQLN